MIKGNYQRRYLRAPYKEEILYSDGENVLKASTINISEDGILIDHLPSFPSQDDVPLIFPLRIYPVLKNLSLYQLQTFSSDLITTSIVQAKARMVRREQLSQDLENIFKSRFGLHFVSITNEHKNMIETYVSTFSVNMIYLQTLVDSFNSDEETRLRTRVVANILGYRAHEKIAKLRLEVSNDYNGLQWL